MKTEVYLIQWRGWGWNDHRENGGAGDVITYTSLRKARKALAQQRRETCAYHRLVKRTTITKEVIL